MATDPQGKVYGYILGRPVISFYEVSGNSTAAGDLLYLTVDAVRRVMSTYFCLRPLLNVDIRKQRSNWAGLLKARRAAQPINNVAGYTHTHDCTQIGGGELHGLYVKDTGLYVK